MLSMIMNLNISFVFKPKNSSISCIDRIM